MSFQKEINTFLDEKLNNNSINLRFNLFYRFGITQENFTEFIFDSVDWLDTGVGAENNVVVNYDGVDYNTQLGAYTLEEVNYIPCIIEDYIVEYEPYNFLKSAYYIIPITFFVNETVNKDLDPDIVDAIEEMQDTIRGEVFEFSTTRGLLNHSDIKPMSGVIEHNGTIFREYSMNIYIKTIDNGYFANEITYRFTHPDINGGQTMVINPVVMSSSKGNDIHSFQIFQSDTNNSVEMSGVPNTTVMAQELTFVYKSDELTNWLVRQKYNKAKPQKVNIGVEYPNFGSTFTRDYVIQNVSGLEEHGDIITVTITLSPVSEVYV